ncbi:MAG: ATP-binding protein, partial [Candidatus Saccharimonadales bacterium]
KHVFEKFYRSEDFRTRETSGTGLGLYVVSKLMHKLGTKVDVTSRLNHGSAFQFVLTDAARSTKT